jgi:phage gp29-like protein
MNGPPPGPNEAGPAGIPLTDMSRIFGGASKINTQDPAFQSPQEQLGTPTRSYAKTVYRDLPLVTIQNTWSIEGARAALGSHIQGLFEQSAQLWDSVIGDDRVTATMGSRNAGLFGREARFEAADDSDAAKECLDAWRAWWPRLSGDASMTEINSYAIGMGFCPSQLVWDTAGTVWGPYLRPWAPRFTYYHWPLRRFIALSQDGPIVIEPGNAKWVMHLPKSSERPWMYGAIRPVVEPWMLRHLAFRDMARFSEVHGLPARVGKVPAVSDPTERSAFETSLSKVGHDAAMILPQGVDGQEGTGYGYELVEAKDRAWEVFGGLIEKCDTAIVLSILFQNLTTEVTGGSFAATSAHMDIRQSGLQGDDAAWQHTMYQIARPFAYLNFGDPNLAPRTYRDVEPREDLESNAKQFQQFATAVEYLARAGLKFDSDDALRRFAANKFGLDGLPNFEIGDPKVGLTS